MLMANVLSGEESVADDDDDDPGLCLDGEDGISRCGLSDCTVDQAT